MHGAVTTNDYLVLVGGIGVSGSSVVQLSVYTYACNQWTDVAGLMLGKFCSTRQASSKVTEFE